jgi:hypothetical protein
MLTKEEMVYCPLCSEVVDTKVHEEAIEVDENQKCY